MFNSIVKLVLFLLLFTSCNAQQNDEKKIDDKVINELLERELQNQNRAKYGNTKATVDIITDKATVEQMQHEIEKVVKKRADNKIRSLSKTEALAKKYKEGDKTVLPKIMQVLKGRNKEEKSDMYYRLQNEWENPKPVITDQELIDYVISSIDNIIDEDNAVQLAGYNILPGYEKKMEERLLSGKSTVTGRLLFWLGKTGTSEASLDYIEKLIREHRLPNQQLDNVVDGLSGFGENGDAAIKKKVGNIAMLIYEKGYVTKEDLQNIRSVVRTSNAPEDLLECLFLYGDKRVEPIATDIFNRGIRPSEALIALIRLDGYAYHMDKVYALLKNPDDFFKGLEVVAGLPDDKLDDVLLRATLSGFANKEDINDNEIESLVSSFRTMKKESYLKNINDYISDSKLADRIKTVYKDQLVSYDEIIKDMIAAGLVKKDISPAAIAEYKRKNNDSPVSFIFGVLEGEAVYLGFDAEEGMVPVGYDELLGEFVSKSGGVLNGLISSTDAKDKGNDEYLYTIRVVYNNKAFITKPEDMGDWFDIGTLNLLMDKIMEQSGSEKRFISVETGDQTVQYIFGEPRKVLSFVKKYKISN